nr:YigZ family protein [Pseudomarimonas arenosa]
MATDAQHEIEVKRSRFLALAHPVKSADEALRWIEAVRVPDATHNCWALRIGETYRSSDDGEPGGSAGRPILAAIDGSGLDALAVVVVRWYGGTKLGVGGLIRAYGGAAAECLRLADRREIRTLIRASLSAPFELSGTLYHFCAQHDLQREGESHRSDGLILTVILEQQQLDSLQQALSDATRGRAQLQAMATFEE